MAEEQRSFTIWPVVKSVCIEQRPNGVYTAIFDPSGSSKQQFWVVEQGDSPTTIAIRNAGSGQYLCPGARKDYAELQTGQKRW